MSTNDMTLAMLRMLMQEKGCRNLYLKKLSKNDNSKNQIYLGPDFTSLNILPNKGISPDQKKTNRFKAPLDFYWIDREGTLLNAPGCQLILYPQYPEVRMSGFLKGSIDAPSDLMRPRLANRIMFFGICSDGKIICHVTHPESLLSREIESLNELPAKGVFLELGIEPEKRPEDNEEKLLAELRRIHQLGWIRSKRLSASGAVLPCKARNCGGLTLEAELKIIPNSYSIPDFLGWEVKQYHVRDLHRFNLGKVTLMTPEPAGGYYKAKGIEAFIRRFGYKDLRGREDRLNFGGVHKAWELHPRTKLKLELTGYDREEGKITDAGGGITLVTTDGDKAATWYYADLMNHWQRKHSLAVYIPCISQKEPELEYQYGNLVRLGRGTDFLLFLKALSCGLVYYDPGIKLEDASTKPKPKYRSQFRVKSADISTLYHEMEVVDLNS